MEGSLAMTAKSDVLVKMVLVFFISLLSFSIGTFVGKKYSDNQHKLAAMEPGEGGREVASIVDEHGKAEGTSISDQEISKLAEEFADDSAEKTASTAGEKHGEVADAGHGHGEAHGEAASGGHGEAPAEASGHGEKEKKLVVSKEKETANKGHGEEEVSKPAKNLLAGKAPTENAVHKADSESRLPSSLPKDVAHYSVGKFTLQVAAFNSEDEAKKRAEDLKTKGYSAFYVPANVKGKTWYRVSVGLFATEKEAKDYREEFANKSKIESTIIQKIVN